MAAKKTRRTPKQKNRPQKGGDLHAPKGKDHASKSAMKQLRQHKQTRGR